MNDYDKPQAYPQTGLQMDPSGQFIENRQTKTSQVEVMFEGVTNHEILNLGVYFD